MVLCSDCLNAAVAHRRGGVDGGAEVLLALQQGQSCPAGQTQWIGIVAASGPRGIHRRPPLVQSKWVGLSVVEVAPAVAGAALQTREGRSDLFDWRTRAEPLPLVLLVSTSRFHQCFVLDAPLLFLLLHSFLLLLGLWAELYAV